MSLFLRVIRELRRKGLPNRSLQMLNLRRNSKALNVGAVQGSRHPSHLVALVKDAFTPKRRASAGSGAPRSRDFTGDPYAALGTSESDSGEEIKKKYKQLLLQYRPDRVGHLGPELKELATRRTTEINAAFALIWRLEVSKARRFVSIAAIYQNRLTKSWTSFPCQI